MINIKYISVIIFIIINIMFFFLLFIFFFFFFFFFSSRRRHTRSKRDWSSDVCSSDLVACVAFLGSSSVAGKGQAFDWIGELQRRQQNKHFSFQKFGAGGDLAYNEIGRASCRERV